MGIDVWEGRRRGPRRSPFGLHVVPAGPGLGGHCIPIDPFYLTWKARESRLLQRSSFELAGKVNENMPYYCRSLISQALNHGAKEVAQRLEGARVGVA